MTSAQEIAAAMAQIEEGVLAWNGTGYPCALGVLRRQVQPGDDGDLELMDTLTAYVRAAVLGDVTPRLREKVAVDGRLYRIYAISKQPGGGVLALTLGNAP